MRKRYYAFFLLSFLGVFFGSVLANGEQNIRNLVDRFQNGEKITQAEKELVSNYLLGQNPVPTFTGTTSSSTLNKIPVLGPETFDVFPPVDWSVTSGNSGNAWFDTTNASYGTGTDNYAGWDDDSWGSASDDSTELISSAFSTVGLTNGVVLSFDYGYRVTGAGTFGVEVSNDDGVTWQVAEANLPQTSATASAKYPEAANYSVDITAIAGENTNVRVKFYFRDAGGWLWYGAIDNVTVDEAPSADVGPIALTSPSAYPGSAESISVQVENFAATPLDTDSLQVNVDVTGAATASFSEYFVADSLAAGDTLAVTFANTLDMSAVGVYTLTVTTSVNDDVNSANDTLVVDIETLPSTAAPYFEHFDSTTAGVPGTFPDNWTNAGPNDWYVEASLTGNSGSTGPLNDNSGTGNYVYTEATGGAEGDAFNLLSPPVDLSALAAPTMTFYYHMYGADMGELHVDIYSNGAWIEDATPALVGPQQGAEDEAWLPRVVDLSAYAGSTIGVRFRGLRGPGFTSDMSVDDVNFDEATPDLAVAEFIGLPSAATGSSTISFDVAVTNVGGSAAGTTNLDVTQNGTNVGTFGVAPLNAGESDTVAVSLTTSPSGSVDEIVAALQMVAGDNNPANDTLSQSVVTVDVIPLPFIESWDTTAFDSTIWTEVLGSTEIIDTNSVSTGTFPFDVPSLPYFLSVNGSGASLTSGLFDLTGLADYGLAFWESEHDLEPGESVIIEYFNSSAVWDTLALLPGTDNVFGAYEPFEKMTLGLPADAYHGAFQFRFRAIGPLATTDEWFFDDITIEPVANDVAATFIGAPALTHVSLTQSTTAGAVGIQGTLSNLGLTNTGDANLEVLDENGASVFSDAFAGVTLGTFADSTFSFADWDAGTAGVGTYTMNVFSSAFTDVEPSNDTTSRAFVVTENTLAYDYGVQSTSGTFSGSARSLFGANYTMTDNDTLTSISILVTEFTNPVDSFAVEVWDVVNDTPSTPIATVYSGSYADLGPLPAVVRFELAAPLAVSAGNTYSMVYDMKGQTFAGGSFPCGIDFTALGAGNIPRTFWGQIFAQTTWLAFEDVGAAAWTPIIRASFQEEEPVQLTLPLTEGFNDTTIALPDGWTQIDADGGDEVLGADWRIEPSNINAYPVLDGDGVAFNNFQAANSAGLIDEWIFTPQILDYQSGMELSFNLIHTAGVWDDSVMVLVSTTDADPTSFSQIDYLSAPDAWTEYSYDLEDFGVNAGDNFYLAFRYYVVSGGSSGNHSNAFAMDLVTVDFPAVDPPEPLMNLVHTPGDLNAAIYNDGSIGADQVSTTGPGMTWKGVNGIYVGGPIFASGTVGVANGHIGSFTITGDVLNVTSNFAAGFTTDPNFDQVTTAYLNDAGAPTPYGVKIIQKSYSNTGDDFMFVRYGYVNESGAALTDFYTGMFVDFDVTSATFGTNQGAVDTSFQLVYTWNDGDPYYGFASMDGLSGGHATDAGGINTIRTETFTFMSTFDFTTSGPADIRQWGGTHVGDIAAGDTAWTTWALVAGDDLAQIQANAYDANQRAFALGWIGDVTVGIGDDQAGIPVEFALEQNYPNPFNPTTTLEYSLKERVDVSLKIYNVLGQLVRTVVDENQAAGIKKAEWNGTNDAGARVASGIYIYRLEAGDFVQSKKMILLK